MRPRWSVAEPGCSEAAWIRCAPWARLLSVDVDALAERYERVLIVVPHPDDESLALGGLLADLAARAMPIEIVLVTDGEGSHPHVPALTHAMLARVRRDELTAAVAALGVDAPVRRLALPDGGIEHAASELANALDDALAGSARALVLAPWCEDGHSDHDAAGRVARDVARARGADIAHYLVWVWHWCDPQNFDWNDAVLVAPSADALHRKDAALACYASQTSTFALPDGREPLLRPDVIAHARRTVETISDPDGVLPRALQAAGRTPSQSFDAMFESTQDPWGVESRWYERRRRAVIEAVLPNERLGRLLDLGCSTGVLTRALAARAASVVAIDHSERALGIAREDTPDSSDIVWQRGELPEALDHIEGTFDTIIVSELAYFLDGRNLLRLLAGLTARLAPGGIVLTANWQRPTRDIPLDGPLVDRQIAAALRTVATYEDADVVVRILERADTGEGS